MSQYKEALQQTIDTTAFYNTKAHVRNRNTKKTMNKRGVRMFGMGFLLLAMAVMVTITNATLGITVYHIDARIDRVNMFINDLEGY